MLEFGIKLMLFLFVKLIHIWTALNCILWESKLFMMQIKCHRQIPPAWICWRYVWSCNTHHWNDVNADERWNNDVLRLSTSVQCNQVDRHFECFADAMSTNYHLEQPMYISHLSIWYLYWFGSAREQEGEEKKCTWHLPFLLCLANDASEFD